MSNNQAMPKVIIALPVYNGSEWIEQALDSLVALDYENVDIIICDDCSTDDTAIICESYSQRFDQIQFSSNALNLGGIENLVQILERSDSEYFVWASQDDYWHPAYLSILINRLEEDKGLVLASGNIEMIGIDGSSSIKDFKGFWNPEKLNQFMLVASFLLPVKYGNWLKNNLFLHGVVRTEALKKSFRLLVGTPALDRVYILFLVLQGRWGYVDRVLYHRRLGTGQLVRDKKDFDAIKDKELNPLAILLDGWMMLRGVWSIDSASTLLKVFTYLCIVGFVLSKYLRQFIYRILGKNIFKRILPITLVNLILRQSRNRVSK